MNISDEELMAYCDGAVEGVRAAQILEAAQHDSKLAHRIQIMEASQLPYKVAFSQQPIPPIPESLINHVENMVKLGSSEEPAFKTKDRISDDGSSPWFSRHSWNYVGIAASLAICFLLGHSMANRQNKAEIQAIQQTQSVQADWVRRVADYQTLYVENTVADVVSSADETSSLFSRIESGGLLQTELPDLSSHGYTFVRAQELGYKGEPLVQLVYSKPGVAPLALCYMPSSDRQSAEVHIGSHEGLHTADWIKNGQRFVIVGEESTEVMQSLYKLASKLWI